MSFMKALFHRKPKEIKQEAPQYVDDRDKSFKV